MIKIILSIILSIPVSACAFAGLHKYYELPVYAAIPATVAVQLLNLLGDSLLNDKQ